MNHVAQPRFLSYCTGFSLCRKGQKQVQHSARGRRTNGRSRCPQLALRSCSDWTRVAWGRGFRCAIYKLPALFLTAAKEATTSLDRTRRSSAVSFKQERKNRSVTVKYCCFTDAGTLLKRFLCFPVSLVHSPADPMLLHQFMNGALEVMHPTALQKDTTFTKIFVGGLPYHTNDASLRKYFEAFGDIDEAVVITDRQTGKSRGYGFVSTKKTP